MYVSLTQFISHTTIGRPVLSAVKTRKLQHNWAGTIHNSNTTQLYNLAYQTEYSYKHSNYNNWSHYSHTHTNCNHNTSRHDKYHMFQRIIYRYGQLLQNRPYTTQITTSIILLTLSDITAQKLEDKQCNNTSTEYRTIDTRRIVACMIFGVGVGIAGHKWYILLDNIVCRYISTQSRSIRNISCKIILDTLIFNPIFLFSFFTIHSVADRSTFHEYRYKLQHDYMNCLMVDCAVWPILQLYNFRYVRVVNQLLIINIFAYIENIFFDLVSHNGTQDVVDELIHTIQQMIIGDTDVDDHIIFINTTHA